MIKANSEERAKAALDVFKEKLIKRRISLKSLDAGEPRPRASISIITSSMKQGIVRTTRRKWPS